MLLNQDDHLPVMADSPILMFPVKRALQDSEVNLTPHLESTFSLTLQSLPARSA